jgi:hypothetical protein
MVATAEHKNGTMGSVHRRPCVRTTQMTPPIAPILLRAHHHPLVPKICVTQAIRKESRAIREFLVQRLSTSDC